ncbi:hypothetical protein PBI_NILO_34 [Mycobacterium phage Nilo]|uniref:Uncharacterized protein n=1 Tax=Mycobacterium phage Nilo TaxID=2108129 RepID=A0A2P1JQR0_9CAUD|nr:hypothetical protein PBI_NILO_34 [Mycobacterium phage Nilo]
MDSQLEAIRDAASPGPGRNLEQARDLADAFVAAHPELYPGWEDKTVHEAVSAVEILRAAGLEEEAWRAEAWILHRWEPQNIGGPAQATIRVVAE